jgi:uncharacterized RDD family membrane protein YckC
VTGPAVPTPTADSAAATPATEPGTSPSPPSPSLPPSSPAAAPLLRRVAALVYESLLLGAVLLLAGFLVGLATAPLTGGSASRSLQVPTLPMRAFWFALLFGVGALYFGWFWTGGRRTLPMTTWRLRLLRADGRTVDLRTALVRYLAAWIGPALAIAGYAALAPTGHPRLALWLLLVTYAWALVDRDRGFLHDRIAATRIVDDRPPRRPRA